MKWLWVALAVCSCASQLPLVQAAQARRGPNCISGARVYDGTSDHLWAPMDITLALGRIESISPAAAVPDPACVDGTGKTLMPGLIDSHAHVGLTAGLPPWELSLPDVERQLTMFTYSGVTTTLIAGAAPALADALDELPHEAPTVFRASRIVTTKEGHPIPLFKSALFWPLSAMVISPTVVEVESDADVPRVVAAELASQPDFIKVVYDALPPGTPQLRLSTLRAIIAEARARGARTIVHVGAAQEAVDAAEAGASLLMHVPWSDLLTDAQVARIAATGVPMVSTRHVYGAIDDVVRQRIALHPLEQTFSEGHEASFTSRPSAFTMSGFGPDYEASLPTLDQTLGENLKKLWAAGVVIFVGTDAGLPGVFQGASMHRELQSLVALGLKPADVLKAATSMPAKYLDPSVRFGVVEPGAVADLLLVSGNPLEEISATENLVAVWKRGVRLERRGAVTP